MKNKKGFWITIALINLVIVAALGLTLRSKILFPIKEINFQYLLHAHSHFAFGGWITLALMTLMIYELLPHSLHSKRLYQWLLAAILFNATGMLFSFPFEGYALYSVIFSTLFMFTTYVFTWAFIKDLLKSNQSKPVVILSIAGLLSLVLSSAGPYVLAYLMATHSGNTLLFRDSIYTYLHLQYNGFFSLSVFALLINQFVKKFNSRQEKVAIRFATLLIATIPPTLFLSYLWHYPTLLVKAIAMIGCLLLAIMLISFIALLKSLKETYKNNNSFIKFITSLALFSFGLKSLLQIGLVFPSIGNMVFSNRPIIIGYLHLVMLGFVSLYLLGHFTYQGLLDVRHTTTRTSIIVFLTGIIFNELLLGMQGLGGILMISSQHYPLLLWIAAIWLFTGVSMVLFARLYYLRSVHVANISCKPIQKKITYSKNIYKQLNNHEPGSIY